ncbi:hypothetical protein C1H46_018187 [Malus baccata]|uniref:Uncharacterized protein n=1 Tax=Malus baccata TaxID=106549 RepID=A0A540MBT3_MALBA|nr:hypothetical protein C1H46_018187 [Malus baccata]
MQESAEVPTAKELKFERHRLLQVYPERNSDDVSTHDSPTLDDVSIHLPSRRNSDGVDQPSS